MENVASSIKALPTSESNSVISSRRETRIADAGGFHGNNFRGMRRGTHKVIEREDRFLRITSRSIAVRDTPGKYSTIVSQLQQNIILRPSEECVVDDVMWIKVECGWVCTLDTNGFECLTPSNEIETIAFIEAETRNKKRISSAICTQLTKSYSLNIARRMARAILKYTKGPKPKHLTNLPDLSIDELLIGLATSTGLKQGEVFEFMKIAASQTSNPIKAIVEISENIDSIMAQRPSSWVKDGLRVLVTTDIRRQNNAFVMAAARGDFKEFYQFLQNGQELSAVHSEFGYTALHAAADFGAKDIVNALCAAGICVNIREAKKGHTPLHFAAMCGRTEIASILLEKGADRTITDLDGYLPYEIADDRGYFECREVLKHRPPEIQHVYVSHCTETSVTISWNAPIFKPKIHAKVLEYIVEWMPVLPGILTSESRRFTTPASQNSYAVQNLFPATSHAFLVYSRSMAGVSDPTSKLITFTMAAPPDAPPPVEIIKVSTNGLMLAWHAPERENGSRIDFYQLELVDYRGSGGSSSSTTGSLITGDSSHNHDMPGGDLLESSSVMSLDSSSSSMTGGSILRKKPNKDTEDKEKKSNGGGGSAPAAAITTRKGKSVSMNLDDHGSSLSSSHMSDKLTTTGNTKKAESAVDENAGGEEDVDGGSDMWHRIIKHRSVNNRLKFVMGLEPKRPYKIRVRCHNELGFSDWSPWSPPVAPQSGIYVKEFRLQDITDIHNSNDTGGKLLGTATATAGAKKKTALSAHFTWFAPVLSHGRRTTGYEFQMCLLTGPVMKTIVTGTRTSNISNSSSSSSSKNHLIGDPSAGSEQVFETVSDRISTNELVIDDLKGGCKYQCRVRPRIGDHWVGWESALVSEVITMPASLPDCPYDVRPAPLVELPVVEDDDENDVDAEEEDDEEIDEEFQGVDKVGSKPSAAAATAAVTQEYEIHHDCIVIQWTNGDANGSPIIEYQIICAKVREYRTDDVMRANAAVSSSSLLSEQLSGMSLGGLSSGPFGVDGGEKEAEGEEAEDPKVLSLPWKEVTKEGEMLGPHAFRVKNLLPGASYSIRIRQRNAKGWSPYSRACPPITTKLTIPPDAPEAVKTHAFDALIRWRENGVERFGFQYSLDQDLQIASLTLGQVREYQQCVSMSDREVMAFMSTVVWKRAVTRRVDGAKSGSAADDDEEEDDDEDEQVSILGRPHSHSPNQEPDGPTKAVYATVLVDRLSPGTAYVARVRVRTVAGWSSFSGVSKVFRTSGAP